MPTTPMIIVSMNFPLQLSLLQSCTEKAKLKLFNQRKSRVTELLMRANRNALRQNLSSASAYPSVVSVGQSSFKESVLETQLVTIPQLLRLCGTLEERIMINCFSLEVCINNFKSFVLPVRARIWQ